ncbi:hypothetical protein RB195_001603 [Necator americanus]|uniref:Uncharacterized protein n=1 Tax=Necator americanus TaxID=51031 RepID=A0ABR1DF37_NECAM
MYKKCVSNVASIMVNISARGQPFLYTAAVLFSGSYNRGSLCFSRSSCCIIPSSNNESNDKSPKILNFARFSLLD